MNAIDRLFEDDPSKWIAELPLYQRDSIEQLLSSGKSYDEVAQSWLTASAANTYRFGSTQPVGKENTFLSNLKAEVRAFLCGDKKYKNERDGLFGKDSLARTYVVSTIAVAISQNLAVAPTVIAPVVALVLAAIGKVSINAWCATSDKS